MKPVERRGDVLGLPAAVMLEQSPPPPALGGQQPERPGLPVSKVETDPRPRRVSSGADVS